MKNNTKIPWRKTPEAKKHLREYHKRWRKDNAAHLKQYNQTPQRKNSKAVSDKKYAQTAKGSEVRKNISRRYTYSQKGKAYYKKWASENPDKRKEYGFKHKQKLRLQIIQKKPAIVTSPSAATLAKIEAKRIKTNRRLLAQYYAHRDKIAEERKQRRLRNGDEIRKKEMERYYANHDAILEHRQLKRLQNLEKFRQYGREYWKRIKEKVNLKRRKNNLKK